MTTSSESPLIFLMAFPIYGQNIAIRLLELLSRNHLLKLSLKERVYLLMHNTSQVAYIFNA